MEEIDYKEEDNLELVWGWWLADKDYIEWLKHKDEIIENNQLELFEVVNNEDR